MQCYCDKCELKRRRGSEITAMELLTAITILLIIALLIIK